MADGALSATVRYRAAVWCQYRFNDIAIQPRKAHSRLMDAVFPYALGALLFVMVAGIAVAMLVW